MGSKGENNRQRIVEAADQLFYTRGYNQTSFRDISDATGIPRGNFYYYFKTKDDILNAVVDSRLTGIKDYIQYCEDKVQSAHARLIEFTNLYETEEDNVLEFGCPIGTLTSELAKDEQDLQKISNAVFEVSRDWLIRQFADIGFTDAEERAMDMLARMQGISVISCAFKDRSFLRRSHAGLKSWINAQTLN